MSIENIPTAIWPVKSGLYKVVQFEDTKMPYIRFAINHGLDGYHESIVEKFAEEIGITCVKIEGTYGSLATLPEDSAFKMIGAGICNVNLEQRTAIFWDRSADYDKEIDYTQLRKLRSLYPDWKIH
mgnify:CR=1 FL=1